MGESLIQQYRVGDEGYFDCKTLSIKMIMTVFIEEVPANFVPAAAVRQEGLVLFGIIGRKGCEGGYFKLKVKNLGLTWGRLLKLTNLSIREDIGISSGEIICVDIRRNTKGEGKYLA